MDSRFVQQLACTTALSACVVANAAYANPDGGNVVAGSATIDQAGKTLTINQSSNKAVINWQSFNIAADEITQFNQPSSSSITLNKVLSPNASVIAGQLKANGNVMVINQNGVVFTDTAKVDVNSLVVSTADIDTDDFMNGNYNFQHAGNADAKVINHGEITAGEAGLVGFVAPQVENHGVIRAKLGKVQLAAGDTFALDMYGDGLINVEVSDAVAQTMVTNTGTIAAEGGDVLISAASGRNLVDQLINVSGEIHATTFAASEGSVKIFAEKPTNGDPNIGKIQLAGDIDVSGKGAGETAGNVEILANTIQLSGTASIDASASAGGGDVMVGGDYQGGNGVQTATTTDIDEGATITVSALDEGDAGRAIIWSDDYTEFHGDIFAQGGAISGDGGFVEVSGKDTLFYGGMVNLLATDGENGLLYLDPTNFGIGAGATGANYWNVGDLATQLGLGDVLVQTAAGGGDDGDITVDAALSWASANTLTLDAHDDITIDATITNTGTGGLILDGLGIIDVNQAITLAGGDLQFINAADLQIGAHLTTGGGDITIANSVTAASQQGHLTFNAGAGAINIGTSGYNVGNQWFSAIADGFDFDGEISSTNFTTISLRTGTDAHDFGIGTGAAGNVVIDDTSLSFLNGDITYHTENGDIYINQHTNSAKTDNILFEARNGAINITDTLAFGNDHVTFEAHTGFDVAQAISGSGNLVFGAAQNWNTIGIGDGQAGVLNLDNSELDNITDGFNQITFRQHQNGTINLGARTWSDNLSLFTYDALNFNGAQNFGANNVTLYTGNPTIGAALSGTGNIEFQRVGSQIGDGAGGNYLTNTELINITDGFNLITFRSEWSHITVDVDAYEFTDSVRFISSNWSSADEQIFIEGDLVAAAGSDVNFSFVGNEGAENHNMDVVTINANIDTSQAAAGFGNVTFGNASLAANNIESVVLNGNITTGGGDITFLNGIGAATLSSDVVLNSGDGSITVGNGGLNAGAHALGLYSDTLVSLTNVTGTGELNISVGTAGKDIQLGSTSDAAALSIDQATITSLGGTTFSTINIGDANAGDLDVDGAVNFGANDFILTTGGTMDLASTLTGTGSLTLAGVDAIGTDAAATDLTDTELGRIQDGFSSVTFDAVGSAMVIDTDGHNFTDATTFSSTSTIALNDTLTATGDGAFTFAGSSALTLDANITTAAGDITIADSVTGTTTTGHRTFDANTGTITVGTGGIAAGANLKLEANDFVINGNLSGTGHMHFDTDSADMGVGDGQAGAASFTNAELARIQDGFNLVTFQVEFAQDMNIGAYTWTDNMAFTTASSGDININGVQNFGANNAVFSDVGGAQINANLIGTGNLEFVRADFIGDDAGGGAHITDTELGRIQDGFNLITFNSLGDIVIDTDGYEFSDSVMFETRANITVDEIAIAAGSDTNLTFAGTGAPPHVNASDAITINGAIDASGAAAGFGAVTIFNADAVALNADILTAGGNIDIQDTVTTTTTTGARILNAGVGDITIGTGGISAGADNVSFIGDDFAINGALTGTGQLSFAASGGVMFGIADGADATGSTISSASLNNITDGWGAILFRGDGADIDVHAHTWSDSVGFNAGGAGVTFDGAQDLGGNDLTANVGTTLDINASLSNGNNLAFLTPGTAGHSWAVGDDAIANIGATFGIAPALVAEVDDASLGNIADGWNQVSFQSQGTTFLDTAAATHTINDAWVLQGIDNVRVDTAINASAASDAALTLRGESGNNADLIDVNAAIDLSAAAAGQGAVTFDYADAVNIGGNITTAGGNITLADSVTGTTNPGGNRTLNAGTGAINIGTGGYTNGAWQLFLEAEDFDIRGAVSSSLLSFEANNSADFGVGDGQAGDAHLSNAEIALLTANDLRFRAIDDTVNVGAYTHDDATVRYYGDTINVNGALVAANNMEFWTTTDVVIDPAASLSGPGTLTFGNTSGNTAIGSDAAGTILTDAELGRITDGWGQWLFHINGNLTIDTDTYEFVDSVQFRSNFHDLTIDDTLTAAAGSDTNFTIRSGTGAGDEIIVNAAIDTSNAAAGFGDVTFERAETLSLGANVTTGGGNITIANDVAATTTTGARILNAMAGNISIGTGGVDAGADNLDLIADNMTLNGNLDGTGDLTLETSTAGRDMNVGDGTVGAFDLSNAELGQIQNNFNWVRLNAGGSMNVGGSWTQGTDVNLEAQNINLNGDINVGTNALSLLANLADIAYASGTLTADTLNLDAMTTMAANINAANVDINANSTGATLTGLVGGAADQAAADAILGGPGNDALYTFEGFTIRLVGAPPPPPPPPPGGGGGGGAPAPTPAQMTNSDLPDTVVYTITNTEEALTPRAPMIEIANDFRGPRKTAPETVIVEQPINPIAVNEGVEPVLSYDAEIPMDLEPEVNETQREVVLTDANNTFSISIADAEPSSVNMRQTYSEDIPSEAFLESLYDERNGEDLEENLEQVKKVLSESLSLRIWNF